MLGIDGLLLLIVIFTPSSNSLFRRVTRHDRDFEAISLLIFLSTLLMINGLLDLKPASDGSGLVAGIWVVPGDGLTTFLGIIFLLTAMIALFLLLAGEFLSGMSASP